MNGRGADRERRQAKEKGGPEGADFLARRPGMQRLSHPHDYTLRVYTGQIFSDAVTMALRRFLVPRTA
jgi:hypothetical protein